MCEPGECGTFQWVAKDVYWPADLLEINVAQVIESFEFSALNFTERFYLLAYAVFELMDARAVGHDTGLFGCIGMQVDNADGARGVLFMLGVIEIVE